MATSTLQPFGTRAPRVLRASTPRTASAAASSLRHGLAQRAPRLHQFEQPPLSPQRQVTSLQRAYQPSTGRDRQPVAVQARRDSSQQQEQQLDNTQQEAPQQPSKGGSLGSVGLFVLWAGFVAYAFLLSPNQTPVRDGYLIQYALKEGVGLAGDAGFKVNAIFTRLFYVMGIWPLIYTALLFPAGRSGNGVPAWPFATASYAVGAFALLPYMALWSPPKTPPSLPPAKKDLEGGWKNNFIKGLESPFLGPLVLVSTLVIFYQAATAGPEAWTDYFRLFESSRLVHATSIDFCVLTALAPFWVYNDAELRKWEQRDKLVPLLSLLPVVGPAIYLCLRPKAQ